MTVELLIWATLGAMALTAAAVCARLVATRQTADIVLLLQLLSAKAIAVFFLFSILYGVAAFAETALAIALLGAVAAAVFAFRRPS